jgi:hypothetical protein
LYVRLFRQNKYHTHFRMSMPENLLQPIATSVTHVVMMVQSDFPGAPYCMTFRSRALLLLATASLAALPVCRAAAQLPEESQTGDPKLDYKLRSARAESDYADVCESTDQIVELADELIKAFTTGTPGGNTSDKTFDRLRKLARKVRSQVGGSGDPQMDDPPTNPVDTAKALGTRGRELADLLRQSTRYGVSARMIILSSEIVFLADQLKRMGGQSR